MKRIYLISIAGSLAMASGWGLSGCGKKVISDEVADVHGRAAGALVQPIHAAVESGGTVLLVHKQGDNPVLHAWEDVLGDELDNRFELVLFGPAEMSQEASTSYSGSAPVVEALGAHPGAVAVISTLPMESADVRNLPPDCPPIFALEWPFPDAAAPLVRNGIVPAGVFEFYANMYPEFTPDPAALIDGKYLLLDRESIAVFERR